MLSRKKNKLLPKGDFISIEEASLDDSSEIPFRCETIDEIVEQGIMPFAKALEAYGVTIEQYVGYMMLKGKKQKIDVTEKMILSLVRFTLSILDLSNTNLKPKTNKVVEDMRLLTS